MKITITDLKKSFGDHMAVNISNFAVNHGQLLGLVGNNGAGKTTLFRLLLDLLKADEGQIQLCPTTGSGEEDTMSPATSEDWKSYTGAYIDDGFLIDFLTPEEYFHFIGKINGLSVSETGERVAYFAQFMGGEILGTKKLIRNFSAGNKQKIGIVAAMINHPQLLILDEPFNFLDPTSQNVLKHLLKEYNRQSGATILVSSHNLNHTVDISSRIALLENGVILQDIDNTGGGAAQVLEDYFNV